jgi:hypothetical protein
MGLTGKDCESPLQHPTLYKELKKSSQSWPKTGVKYGIPLHLLACWFIYRYGCAGAAMSDCENS